MFNKRAWIGYSHNFLMRFGLLKPGNRLTILAYHRVMPERGGECFSESLITRTVAEFEQEVFYLKNNFNIIPLAKALEYGAQNSMPANSLVITFDDGYRDNFNYAWPILKKHNLPMSLFVSSSILNDPLQPLWPDRLLYAIKLDSEKTSRLLGHECSNPLELLDYFTRVDNQERISKIEKLERNMKLNGQYGWAKELYLNRDELRVMSDQGVEIGAHTVTHPILSLLTEAEMENEIVSSKKTIENCLNKKVQFFAYPNGGRNDFTQTTIMLLKKAGFRAAFSCYGGFNAGNIIENKYSLNRIPMGSRRYDLGCNLLRSFLKTNE